MAKFAPRVMSWLPLIVILAGVAAYATSFDGVFAFDDERTIIKNDSIRRLSDPIDILTHDRRPIVNLSLAINYALGGLNVGGYHAFNLAVHILAALTLYGLVRRTLLLGVLRDRMGSAASWLATAVATIWVVHPLNTQAVTYVIQRAESMAGLFYLLTLYCTVRAIDAPRRWPWYVAAVASCATGMGCKGVVVTAPVMVILYDWVFVRASTRQTRERRWPLYLGLAATWVVLIQTGVISVLTPDETGRKDVGFGVPGVPALEYAMTQPGVVLHYLRLSFWPHPLCLDYDWPLARNPAEIVPAALMILALLCGTLWALLRRSWLGFAGAWFFVILAPTSSFIPIKDPAFEHRMYLPLAAVVVVAVAGVRLLLRQMIRVPSGETRARTAGVALVGACTLALGVLTAKRNLDYHSEEALWQSVVEAAPQNARAWNGLGCAIHTAGRPADAIEYYRRAIEVDPEHADAHYNLGKAFTAIGRVDDAARKYRETLQIAPGYAKAWNNYGNVLLDQGRTEDAIERYRRALECDPDYFVCRKNLAQALISVRRLDEAVEQYSRVLRERPNDFGSQMNLGAAYAEQGQTDLAIQHMKKALRIRPELRDAHFNLATMLWRAGRRSEAIDHFREALRLDPEDAETRRRLAEALQAAGRAEEARELLQHATSTMTEITRP